MIRGVILKSVLQFFGLFGLSNRASSMIGPNVIQAIIDKTGDNWKGFPFLFALCAAASIVIWFGGCLSPCQCATISLKWNGVLQVSMSPRGGAMQSRGRRNTVRMRIPAFGQRSPRDGPAPLALLTRNEVDVTF